MPDLIIIDITENEKTFLDGSLNKKEIKGNGKIVIKNPSKKSKLWNLICDLKETVYTTNDSREINVGILNPSQEYTMIYEIQNLKKPSLKIIENFDTNNELIDRENNLFLFNRDNECKLQLYLINPLKQPISNINISRDLPEIFQDIEVKNPNIGIACIKEIIGKKILNWDIITLESEQKAELEIILKVKRPNIDFISLGSLKATYLINNFKLTLLDPEIRGLTDLVSEIVHNETSQPGIWNCTVHFINKSEFQVRIEEVKVSNKKASGAETVVSQTPNRLLNPEESWNYDFTVDCKDVPELNSLIEFTSLYIVITRVMGEILKESTIYSA
jgi:hypothetical protein